MPGRAKSRVHGESSSSFAVVVLARRELYAVPDARASVELERSVSAVRARPKVQAKNHQRGKWLRHWERPTIRRPGQTRLHSRDSRQVRSNRQTDLGVWRRPNFRMEPQHDCSDD
jgi:hypothetical protein